MFLASQDFRLCFFPSWPWQNPIWPLGSWDLSEKLGAARVEFRGPLGEGCRPPMWPTVFRGTLPSFAVYFFFLGVLGRAGFSFFTTAVKEAPEKNQLRTTVHPTLFCTGLARALLRGVVLWELPEKKFVPTRSAD